MNQFIGVDLGGTNLRAALVNTDSGEFNHLIYTPAHAEEGHDAVMKRMIQLINEVLNRSSLDKDQIGGIGIGVPGILDLAKGIVLFLPNLPGTWPNVPLKQVVEEGTGLPVYLLNDVRSMTLAEWTFGAGRVVDTIACFAIGTGIGGGLVINGKLHLGIGGTGGELGHQIIDMNGPNCGCGGQGCLEAFASGPAIAAMGVKAVMQGLTTSIGPKANYDLNKIDTKLIAEAALEGDPIAKDIYEKAGFYIGIGVSNVLAIVGPRKVVIGGGVSQAGDLLLEPIRRTVQERVHIMPVEEVEIVPAALGTYAGIIGAALWARDQISSNKSKP